ncbi:MAG: SWIM zinc finger family protein [Myxococcales bacterium]|nr:SWIM zinc finger family protein [Myxococcales bacterium]
MGFYEWRPYVSVADKKAKAERKMKKLRKKGKRIFPVEINGRTIAHSFWGEAWCIHLSSFADYDQRLERGARYVRNGSVCHLEILGGDIEAMVAGSEVYEVEIDIAPISKKAWEKLKKRCTGEIGSVLELLQGKLSERVMEIVCDPDQGLFPTLREIHFSCTCPDWADMCKHVAAVMYGVGHRLDARPDLLFSLRGVDPKELINEDLVLPETNVPNELEGEDLSALFGIDLEMEAETEAKDDLSQQTAGAEKHTPPRLGRESPRKEKKTSHKEKKSPKKETKSSSTKKSPKKEKVPEKEKSSSAKEKAPEKEKAPKKEKSSSTKAKAKTTDVSGKSVEKMRWEVGNSVRVRKGVYDPDDSAIHLGGYRGRIVAVYQEDGEDLVEIAWDSQTLRALPRSFIFESLRESLDWTRMLLHAEDLLACKERDTWEDVQRTISEMERVHAFLDMS